MEEHIDFDGVKPKVSEKPAGRTPLIAQDSEKKTRWKISDGRWAPDAAVGALLHLPPLLVVLW